MYHVYNYLTCVFYLARVTKVVNSLVENTNKTGLIYPRIIVTRSLQLYWFVIYFGGWKNINDTKSFAQTVVDKVRRDYFSLKDRVEIMC